MIESVRPFEILEVCPKVDSFETEQFVRRWCDGGENRRKLGVGNFRIIVCRFA